MKQKQIMQRIMIWFLPLIAIGGLFNAYLGYLLVAMMAFFLPFSFFRGRYWCGHLCPRGAFLDMIMPQASLQRPIPHIFVLRNFKWAIFWIFMAFMLYRVGRSWGNILSLGMVFVSVCVITTIVSIALAIFMKPRAWCAICPMGTLQEKISSLSRKE